MKHTIAAGALLLVVACSNGSSAAEVEMRLIAFGPDELTVTVGTEVTWTQTDAGFHTVSAGTVDVDDSGEITTTPARAFGSERLAKGETFSHTFDEPGSYPYFCEIHPATMRGRIDVK